MPYFIAISWFSSTFSFATFILPFIVLDSSSTAGPTILHGPHHSAQKSTNTGKFEFVTTVSHDLVVTGITFSLLLSITFKYINPYLNCFENYNMIPFDSGTTIDIKPVAIITSF